MTSVARHYESLLAPIYLWMAGGLDSALSGGAADVAEFLATPGYAVDLGAGFGMHAIPLAWAGFQVLAIDTSSHLLEQLRHNSVGLPVVTQQADLREFARYTARPADLILCMGDTLAHLASAEEVSALLREVAASLRPGGRFVATLRDYRNLPSGEKRFIPVRSDPQMIHTCFLEEAADGVVVYDILHEYRERAWHQRVSSYKKLRLSPESVLRAAEDAGLSCLSRPGVSGMYTILAQSGRA
jgi:SAM-dependent methyltransferase